MEYDYRKKPDHNWSYYVVDHLPTMANIFRYDTIEEAMAKYESLPTSKKSAIGSSIHSRNEIDHIHRCDGKNVLVTDADRMQNPLWRESGQIQNAIDAMIAHLNVQHQYCYLFDGHPSVIVDLERHLASQPESYFRDKLLRTDGEKLYTDPNRTLTSAVSEVFVSGKGWMDRNAFLKALDNSRPSGPGQGAKNLFVDRLNIHYIDETGHVGQADISPHDFMLLMEKTAKEISPEKLAADLYRFACDVDPYDAMDQADRRDQELQAIQKDLASGSLYPYTKQLSEGLSEGFSSEALQHKALSLLARLTILTPKQFRKPALSAMISGAQDTANKQSLTNARAGVFEKGHEASQRVPSER